MVLFSAIETFKVFLRPLTLALFELALIASFKRSAVLPVYSVRVSLFL
jgi:hypothetical protein